MSLVKTNPLFEKLCEELQVQEEEVPVSECCHSMMVQESQIKNRRCPKCKKPCKIIAL